MMLFAWRDKPLLACVIRSMMATDREVVPLPPMKMSTAQQRQGRRVGMFVLDSVFISGVEEGGAHAQVWPGICIGQKRGPNCERGGNSSTQSARNRLHALAGPFRHKALRRCHLLLAKKAAAWDTLRRFEHLQLQGRGLRNTLAKPQGKPSLPDVTRF